ncbi:unnamed protein product [Ceutorhynchus assimilis]|uniref:RING-type domain-containing protein n=1 Tax=Ceutorhynchus assimilis TaxID=467358 RepID=A0A9N9MDY2_9CUCU|nr:unnamed protein product [Ceutorhynchus assimilis]
MEGNFVLAEYSSNINSVIKQTFQSMQRIKLTCFDASPHYLIFGATSGGIYIFQCCQFVKLIPSKEGSASLIAISKDEHNVAVATSRGLILVLQNFLEDSSKYQVFSEHEMRNVTYFKWHKNELYVGDDRGKVSIINASFQTTKSIFQLPTATLMTLDSAIVQIDTYRSFLLISTKTKTYLCNTEQERFIQIGKKLRDGYYGACFSNNHNDTDEIPILSTKSNNYESVNELLSNCNDSNTKIYCARPGARLWEANLEAKVLTTYQFKGALKAESSKVLVIGCEEESTLKITQSQGSLDQFNFQKIYCLGERFVLTYYLDKLYVFDPVEGKLAFWIGFDCGIKDVAFIGNGQVYVWKDNLEISVLAVLQLETLILSTLYKKQFYLCTEICLEYSEAVLKLLETSKKLYLLSALATKISDNDLLPKLGPIFAKIKQTNEKFLRNPQKTNNIVVVDNLYSTKPATIPTIIEDKNKDLKLMLKQYNLNKTHKTIDIPEVSNLLNNFSNKQELFILFKQFAEYVKAELNEDSIDWCQNQYLKQISQRNISVKDLDQESFEFLIEAVTKSNNLINFSCPCGYPLPKCHKNAPNFYKTALDLFNSRKINTEQILKSIPYLWRYKIKTEIYGLNIPALIQYSNLDLFKEYTLELVYDNWHDVLGYFVKLNKSICLNCDKRIDIESVLSWTEVAKVIVQSLGSKNGIKILEKYEKFIPNGALDAGFYQLCVFAHSFKDENKMKRDVPFRFYKELNKEALGQLQQCMANNFKRKYTSVKASYYEFVPEKSGLCQLCNLPLKNDILFDCIKPCSHNFHKFCYERNDNSCNICNNN